MCVCLVVQSDAHRNACAELEDRGWDVCWECGVRTSEGNMDPHLDGRKHQQRVGLKHCDICNVRATSFKNMIQHLRGARHQVSSVRSNIDKWDGPYLTHLT